MRIALAQLNLTIGDFDGNTRRIEAAHARATDSNADLVVYTECATTGYPARDLLSKTAFVTRSTQVLRRLRALTASGPAAIVGFVEPNSGPGNGLFNAVALLDGGDLIAIRHKTLLPSYDIFDEDRYFEPAEENLPVEWRGLRLGLTVCEDIWSDEAEHPRRRYGRDPAGDLAEAGVDLIVNVSASPFQMGKFDIRRRVLTGVARRCEVPVLYCNQVGAHDEIIFDGRSLAVDRGGNLVANGADFSEDLVVVDFVDGELSGTYIPVNGDAAREAYRALVMGVSDYTRRCGFDRVVLGLSGGIDSALTAAIAVDALGADKVMGVAMPSRYSSEGSVSDARALAENLGIRFEIISIEPIYEALLEATRELFAGTEFGVAEENFQARARGVVMMGLSNKLGALLLTTGNKSELAVGYCTLYGDMCGGLAVISDVPKTLVYEIARWLNRDRERIPEATIEKPPSAELRPDQLDQDSLPPYEVLDAIIEAYVERNLDAQQIVAMGIDEATVERWVGVINRNEYKRRQAAPGLRITSKAFGTGRRMPIAASYREV